MPAPAADAPPAVVPRGPSRVPELETAVSNATSKVDETRLATSAAKREIALSKSKLKAAKAELAAAKAEMKLQRVEEDADGRRTAQVRLDAAGRIKALRVIGLKRDKKVLSLRKLEHAHAKAAERLVEAQLEVLRAEEASQPDTVEITKLQTKRAKAEAKEAKARAKVSKAAAVVAGLDAQT